MTDRGFEALVAGGIVLALAVPIGHIVIWENTVETQTVTVTERDRVSNGDGGSESRVYTDQGVFGVGDDPFKGQWNSADIYGKLQPGVTYEVTTVGYRNGLFSLFPNIIKAEELK